MRVLVLCHELPPLGGGGGRIAYELARRLAALGNVLDIIAPAYSGCQPAEATGSVTVHRVRCKRSTVDGSSTWEKISYLSSAASKASELLGRQHYDLVHCHFILPAGIIARWGTKRVPYIITCHGSDVPGHNPYDSRWEHALARPCWKAVLAKAAAVVSPSANLEELLRRAMPSLGERLRRIPNGYPCGRFSESRRGNKILLVSRLTRLKGFQWFLQGVAGVKLDYDVHIVGEGPMRPELERLAQATPTRVVFHGWIDNDAHELRELYESASIFVFPSEAENFPTVLLEAMDAGLAIVTTDVKGCPEVVGEAGVLVPPRSPQALATAVRELMATPEQITRLGQGARNRLATMFDWETVAAQYLAVYGGAVHAFS